MKSANFLEVLRASFAADPGAIAIERGVEGAKGGPDLTYTELDLLAGRVALCRKGSEWG